MVGLFRTVGRILGRTKLSLRMYMMVSLAFIARPAVREKFRQRAVKLALGSSVSVEACVESILNFSFVKSMWSSEFDELFRDAELWGPTPNPDLFSVDTRANVKLLDYQVRGRPLVLNFGSCSWPPFMVRLKRFEEIASRFSRSADFLISYIQEAHASDMWSVGRSNYTIRQHRNLNERFTAAQILADMTSECPIIVDTIDNTACRQYAGRPERLYIIQKGRVVLLQPHGPWCYNLEEIEDWLTANCL